LSSSNNIKNRNVSKIMISPSTPIIEAIQIIDRGGMQIALVVDSEGRLLGTVTDGDVRRGILKGIPMDKPVQMIMNSKPTVVTIGDDIEHILGIMKFKGHRQIPILDNDGVLVSLELLDQLLEPGLKDNWVVLMVGGLGTRLRPLTDDCPKPLLQVGSKPVLETILDSFIASGFHKFYFSLNYKGDMISNYFGDGSHWGVKIRYLYEKERLGTAGALSLLPEKPEHPILVMNGDLLTKVNFCQLLDFHVQQRAKTTMCVREYVSQVPYGVVKFSGSRLEEIVEKPIQTHFINAGIYVLDPETLDLVPKNSYFDMPSLFDKVLKRKEKSVIFPIREYWMDIGQMDDYLKANGEFQGVFG